MNWKKHECSLLEALSDVGSTPTASTISFIDPLRLLHRGRTCLHASPAEKETITADLPTDPSVNPITESIARSQAGDHFLPGINLRKRSVRKPHPKRE